MRCMVEGNGLLVIETSALPRALQLVCGLVLMMALSACGGGHRVDRDIYGPGPGGRYLVGSPYSINGTWYYPAENPSYSAIGTASWYGREFHGNATANGERFDARRLTAAHTTLPMPVLVRVTNLDNNRSIVLRVNDRGPFVSGRILDVSEAAAEQLGFRMQGTARVRVEYVGRADGQPPLVAAAPLTGAAPDTSTVQDAIAAIPPKGAEVPAY
jgi:rare lipoprotein A